MPTMGVYAIRNKVTGRVYIGASKNIERRFKQHHQSLDNGWKSATNRQLREDWLRYGKQAFAFAVVHVATAEGDMAVAEYMLITDARDAGILLYNAFPSLHGQLDLHNHALAVRDLLSPSPPRHVTIRKLAAALSVRPEELTDGK